MTRALYSYLVLALAWLFWVSAFLLRKRNSGKPRQLNAHARWGMILEGIAFALLWQTHFWEHPPATWRFLTSIPLFVAASCLSWTATAALGRHWRVDAGLDQDHQLIRSGPYALIRHPIYTSMLCLFLGMGLILTPWPLFLAALAIFIVGTEIRVRTEDKLLASRFREDFTNYRQNTPPTFRGYDSDIDIFLEGLARITTGGNKQLNHREMAANCRKLFQ